jgi:hypothetical protein
MVAAWLVDRLGRSLQDLVGFLAELQASRCELYLHQQGLDTSANGRPKVGSEREAAVRASLSGGVGILKTVRRRHRATDHGEYGGGGTGLASGAATSVRITQELGIDCPS